MAAVLALTAAPTFLPPPLPFPHRLTQPQVVGAEDEEL